MSAREVGAGGLNPLIPTANPGHSEPRPDIEPDNAAGLSPIQRLVEYVAACLCWAEWGTSLDGRTDDPWSYWQEVSPDARARYMQDARRIASMMQRDRDYALAPAKATEAMRQAALNERRGLRSHAGASDVFDAMVAAARKELRWRKGDVPHEPHGGS